MAISSIIRLSTPVAALLLACSLIIYICIGCFVNYRKLSHFKGPPLAAVTRGWLMMQSLSSRMQIAEAEALKKYGNQKTPCLRDKRPTDTGSSAGSIARIGPNLLVTDDADLLRHMSAPRSRWARGDWYDGMKLDPRVNNVFSERDEKRHAELRAKMIAGYSGKEVENLESDIDNLVLELIQLIKREYTGKVMDFARLAQYFTLDVLSKVAFGTAFGYLEANEDLYDYNKTSAQFLPLLELIINHTSIRAILNSRPVQALAAPKGTDKIGQGRILGIAQRAVAERYGPEAVFKRDMLGSFISRGLTQQQAESESHLQIMAGSDSTSSALRVTFMYIISNPVAYAKLLAEINTAIERGAISHPVIKYTEALQLPYLQACIWEGLRICPPLFGLQSKLAPPQGETVNGIFFPGGTEIGTCPLMVGRRKDVFGNDADIFRPERWIEADPSTRAKYERTTEVIFGSGRYVCLGKNIAWIELSKAFVELLRNYDWGIANPIEGVDSCEHGIYIQRNMNLSAWPRRQ